MCLLPGEIVVLFCGNDFYNAVQFATFALTMISDIVAVEACRVTMYFRYYDFSCCANLYYFTVNLISFPPL